MLFACERRRSRRIRDVRAADLQEEMAEQYFSVPPDPTKTAAIERTSQRARLGEQDGLETSPACELRASAIARPPC